MLLAKQECCDIIENNCKYFRIRRKKAERKTNEKKLLFYRRNRLIEIT